jgi:hypothetical protein
MLVGWFGQMQPSVPVINQCIHWVMVPGMLFWNELPVVVVGKDV